MPATNDDTVHLADRSAAIAGKPCSYSTPLPGIASQGEKTLMQALDMPHEWAHLRGAVVQFLESLESLCRLPLSWLPNWKSLPSSTWTVPRKV
ncbi:hypothetical protein C9I49_09850 [Pseudomonas prosekii]|uniref:Uncharacterized protein n=1 Tax=Pseudomonas prosekii TaxID=1148509 RepID=A0A2U2DA00_9PSED|nr:hypothetical protein C9I49_09850 [Pseudomonas prosekii]